eukprot:g72020.t1
MQRDKKNVLIVSMGFFALFMAFNVSQAFATTALDGNLGTIALAVLYLCFTMNCLLADLYVRLLGAKRCMVIGAIPYIGMILANLYPRAEVVIAANALCGLSAALLWTGQGVYVARCAALAAAAADEPIDKWTSAFNALFFSLFQANGTVGLVLASTILLGASTGSGGLGFAEEVMFAVMAGLGVLGVVVLAVGVPSLQAVYSPVSSHVSADTDQEGTLDLLDGDTEFIPELPHPLAPPSPPPLTSRPRSVNSDGKNSALTVSTGASAATYEGSTLESVAATLELALCDLRMQLMIPLIFFNGASLAFMFGEFPKLVAQPILGKAYIGFVIAAFYGSNALFTSCYGALLSRRCTTRSFLVALAACFITAFFALILFVEIPQNFNSDDVKLQNPTWRSLLIVFSLPVVFAAGDSVLESQVPAILQSYFSSSHKMLNASMGNLKLFQSLGSAYSFMIAAFGQLTVQMRVYILLGMLGLAAICAVALHALGMPFQEDSPPSNNRKNVREGYVRYREL